MLKAARGLWRSCISVTMVNLGSSNVTWFTEQVWMWLFWSLEVMSPIIFQQFDGPWTSFLAVMDIKTWIKTPLPLLLKSADPWSYEGAAMLSRKNGNLTTSSNFKNLDHWQWLGMYLLALICHFWWKVFPYHWTLHMLRPPPCWAGKMAWPLSLQTLKPLTGAFDVSFHIASVVEKAEKPFPLTLSKSWKRFLIIY